MNTVWIVHRDPVERAELARLAGVSDTATLGAPGDGVFLTAPLPDAIVLGLAGDLESELEFAHRTGPAGRTARWILVGEPREVALARRLFDVLPAEYFLHPPAARALRRAVADARADVTAAPLALSQRPARDALSERFARAFGDLELPTLLRALDPRLADVPLLLLGEPGSGRSLLARYTHHFGGTAGGTLVELPCSTATGDAELLDRIAAARERSGVRHMATLWLAEPSRLAPDVQRLLQGWIEFGLPVGATPGHSQRWIATDTGDALSFGLHHALAGLCVRLEPLREQPQRVPGLVTRIAESWCRARGLRPRRVSEAALGALEEYPWPGNLRELEAVVVQSLAASGADPLELADLVLDGERLAPRETGDPPAVETRPARTPAPPAEPPDVEAVLASLGTDAPGASEEQDAAGAGELPLGRLAAAVGAELRGTLASMREAIEQGPTGGANQGELRRRVAEQLERSEGISERLERLTELEPPAPEAVDVSGLIEQLLEERRQQIRARQLVVLEELDPARSRAHCDPGQLQLALEALLDKTFELVPERGDVYLASRRLEAGARAAARVRVLVRYRAPQPRAGEAGGTAKPQAGPADFASVELLLRAQGGSLTVDASDRGETILLLDLPASE